MTLQELLGTDYKDGITVDEITSLLNDKKFVKKDVFDKTASEAAKYKKDLAEKLTEDEKRVEEVKQQQALFESLKRENSINKYEKTYLGNGYTAERAAKIASALADGDFETVAKETAVHAEEKVKLAQAEALKGITKPQGGNQNPPSESWGANMAAEKLQSMGVQVNK